MGTSDRDLRRSQTRSDLRPPIDVRIRCPCRWSQRLRARARMGTSVRMIGRHYGALLDGATAGIASRLDAFDANRNGGPSDALEVGNWPLAGHSYYGSDGVESVVYPRRDRDLAYGACDRSGVALNVMKEGTGRRPPVPKRLALALDRPRGSALPRVAGVSLVVASWHAAARDSGCPYLGRTGANGRARRGLANRPV